jgi:hypothetical protein
MKQFRKYYRKSLAGFMSIWITGVALLLFCQLPAHAKGADFCPLAKASKSHCDHGARKSKSDKSDLFSRNTPQSFDCCSFIPAVFDKNRKLERNKQPATPAVKTEPYRLKMRPPRIGWPKAARASHQLVPERIFIKHRVLRM